MLTSAPLAVALLAAERESLRMLRVSDWSLYRREEAIRDILPDAEKELEVLVRIGLTESQTEDLSHELGASVGGDRISSVSAKLTQAFHQTVTLEREHTRSEKDIIRNNTSRPRKLAIWHIVHRIVVDELVDSAAPEELEWLKRKSFEYEPGGYRYSEWPTDDLIPT
jgi:hypothetical protein